MTDDDLFASFIWTADDEEPSMQQDDEYSSVVESMIREDRCQLSGLVRAVGMAIVRDCVSFDVPPEKIVTAAHHVIRSVVLHSRLEGYDQVQRWYPVWSEDWGLMIASVHDMTDDEIEAVLFVAEAEANSHMVQKATLKAFKRGRE